MPLNLNNQGIESGQLFIYTHLASRILPGIDVPSLLEILHERVGYPLDDEKLKSITVTNLNPSS